MDNRDDIFGKKRDNDDFLLFCDNDDKTLCKNQNKLNNNDDIPVINDSFIETNPEIMDHEKALNSIMDDINASNSNLYSNTSISTDDNFILTDDAVSDNSTSEELVEKEPKNIKNEILEQSPSKEVISREEQPIEENYIKSEREVSIDDLDALENPIDEPIQKEEVTEDNQPKIKKEIADNIVKKPLDQDKEEMLEQQVLKSEPLTLGEEKVVSINDETKKEVTNDQEIESDILNSESLEYNNTAENNQDFYEYEDENDSGKFELTDDLLDDLERINDDFIAEVEEQKAKEVEEARKNSGEDRDAKLENEMELKPIKTDEKTNDILNLNIDNIEDFLRNNNKKICDLRDKESKIPNKIKESGERLEEKDGGDKSIKNNTKIKDDVKMAPEKESDTNEEVVYKKEKSYKKIKVRDEDNYGILDTFELDEDLWEELNLSGELRDKITKRIKIEIKSFVRDNVIPVLEKIIK